jgi:2-polyprenyl-3-methyl-5-hydroxy-6-metoxy-1,4-benzoquinol methylase
MEFLVQDKSNGYEEVAERFMSARNPRIGPAIVREWSHALPPRTSLLDLGCGHGVPISETLIEEGFTVFGVDASRTLIEAFRKRFPNAFAEHRAVEESEFFRRSFDGVVAWGLLFLMPPDTQSLVLHKVARILNPNGKFLFTSPKEVVRWRDVLTDRESISLGAERYHEILHVEGLEVVGERLDEGDNYYYLVSKR